MRDRAVGEREEEREAALPSATAVGLAGAASWPSGQRRMGKGGAGRLRAAGNQRERRGSRAFGPEMREEVSFFSKSFSFLILKSNSNMNQIEFKYYSEYTFDSKIG